MAPVLKAGEVVQAERGEGRWQVERKIGEGQFSEVYAVLDLRTQQQVWLSGERRRRRGRRFHCRVMGCHSSFAQECGCGRQLQHEGDTLGTAQHALGMQPPPPAPTI